VTEDIPPNNGPVNLECHTPLALPRSVLLHMYAASDMYIFRDKGSAEYLLILAVIPHRHQDLISAVRYLRLTVRSTSYRLEDQERVV